LTKGDGTGHRDAQLRIALNEDRLSGRVAAHQMGLWIQLDKRFQLINFPFNLHPVVLRTATVDDDCHCPDAA